MLKIGREAALKFGRRWLVVGFFILVGVMAVNTPARAATRYVDPAAGNDTAGCGVAPGPTACKTIIFAIGQATAGDTLTLAAGTYTENVIVTKSLTIAGAGQASTLLQPAVSHPLCASGGGSLCGGADTPSTVILVQANNVYIHDLTINGDNPGLTSGVTGGGADIDARNGVLTDNNSAVTYDNLRISYVTVKNIYERGIQASGPDLSTSFTFTFDHNTVQNVQADPTGGSIAIFGRGGTGTINNNTVSAASDAISANWSRGTQFLNNTITQSASGVHSDNSEGVTGTAPDLIQGNTVSNCTANGYGIWSFVPYIGPTVQNNRVTGCSVGLAVFGQGQAANSTVNFSGNTIDGANLAGSQGAYITTNVEQAYPGGGYSSVGATFTSNNFINNSTGLFIEQPNGPPAVTPAPVATVSLHFNRIVGNGTGVNNTTGTAFDAINNWWGCNAGPGATGCDKVNGNLKANPWLVLRLTATPTNLLTGGSSSLLADLTYNSAGQNTASLGHLPDGIPVTFQATLGNIAPAATGLTSAQANSTFQAGSVAGTATVSTKVDNQVVSLTILITNRPQPGYGSTPPPGPLDLGKAAPGQPTGLTLLIFNIGTLDLTVSNPVLSGPNAADFKLSGLTFPLTIKPGSPALSLVLFCVPAKTGLRTATLTFSTNDPFQPTVTYTLSCSGVTSEGLPADLIAQLRVTPDRVANNDPANLITYTLIIKNAGPGRSSPPAARLPILPALSLGYAFFSDSQTWVEKIVTDTDQPYVQIRYPAFDPATIVTATVVFRPQIGLSGPAALFSRFYVFWDDDTAAGRSNGSNAVRLSVETLPNRDQSGGVIQLFAPINSNVVTGSLVSLSGDFYAPHEPVELWYTNQQGQSFGLGSQDADGAGHLSFTFQPAGLTPGQTYFVAGRGFRSGVIGSAAVSVQGGTSNPTLYISTNLPPDDTFWLQPPRRIHYAGSAR